MDKDGRLSTSHDAYQPDGTLRHTVKNFDGSIGVTRTKTTKLEDGSEMTKVTSDRGDETTKIARPDGSSELITRHKDGTFESTTVTRTEDGKMVTHSRAADGTESTVTQFTDLDGHEHRTVENADGSTQTFEDWEDRLPDGTTVQHHNGPDATETITNRPDGSTERIKQHTDGTTTSFTRTKEADGSIHEHQVHADGSTRDATYTQQPDGSFTTRSRDFDGTERTTDVGPDGRVEVHTINPDGGRIDSSFSSDGSGRTDILDAGGNIDKSIPVRPDPRPVPLGGHDPEKFLDNAHKELGPDVPIDPPDFTGEAAGFAAAPLSEGRWSSFRSGASFRLVTRRSRRTRLQRTSHRPNRHPPGQSHRANRLHRHDRVGESTPTEAVPGRTLERSPGATMLSEDLPDGTNKLTSVMADGSVLNIIEKTDPSTGITTKVSHATDGDVETTIDSPGGTRQVTTRHPDGSEEIFRSGLAPDGSQWGQSITPDGVQTTHMTFDPDGTI